MGWVTDIYSMYNPGQICQKFFVNVFSLKKRICGFMHRVDEGKFRDSKFV